MYICTKIPYYFKILTCRILLVLGERNIFHFSFFLSFLLSFLKKCKSNLLLDNVAQPFYIWLHSSPAGTLQWNVNRPWRLGTCKVGRTWFNFTVQNAESDCKLEMISGVFNSVAYYSENIMKYTVDRKKS